MELELKSAIYSGWVEHIRHRPAYHRFRYQVFMLYLDLDEIEQVFSLSKLWSSQSRWSPAFFKRSDYLGDASKPLKDEVFRTIREQTGQHFNGSVRLLSNIRYFGFVINPISTYYCFDEHEHLKYVVVEVTNTPWNEKIAYVLTCQENEERLNTTFQKGLHVSPFNPMNMTYHWRSKLPEQQLFIRLSATEADSVVLDANLFLKREKLSGALLTKKVIQYPFMTVKVAIAIYWEAMRLLFKNVPIFKKIKQ